MNPDLIQPQAQEVEAELLGIMILCPEVVDELNINAPLFYSARHQVIYEAIRKLSASSTLDLATLTMYLRDKGQLEEAGGVMYVSKLIENVFSPAKAEQYVVLLKQKYLRREYIRVAQMLSNLAQDERGTDIEDIISFIDEKVLSLSGFIFKKEPRKLIAIIDDILKEIEEIQQHKKRLIGVPSGFVRVDRYTGGWQPGDLIILAGRPSMGKTALAHALAYNSAYLKCPVAFFSLEMSSQQLATRFLSGETGYDNLKIRNADVLMDKVVEASYRLQDLPVIIDDTPCLSIAEMRSKLKRMIVRYGIKLVIVDYLQLMRGEGDIREQEVSFVSRNLKAIAKDFSIPVIALSQLNREVEGRSDKYPRLSDLRESGAIEQDADLIFFIFRPAYYKMKSFSVDGDEVSSDGLIVLDCQKHRNGALFREKLWHNEYYSKIIDEKEQENNELF